MAQTTPLVTIFGGSGFLGRYIAHRMARAGWRVRVAVRRPNEAMFVQPYGDVGQVVPVQANIRDANSTRRAIAGADAVINCVGILQEDKWQKFDVVHAEAANRIARFSAEAGVSKLIHISSIVADADSESEYAASKADGDAGILRNFPNAVILRPSVMFGIEDKFFNRFAAYSRLSPVLPVYCPDTEFQPVYVDDVAAAAEAAVLGDFAGGVYDLGGPDVATMRELVSKAIDATDRKRVLLGVPSWIAGMNAWWFDAIAKMLGGLWPSFMSRDELAQLQTCNFVANGTEGLEFFDITPTPMDSVLEDYLYSFRPSGQYAATTDSGKNLKV